MNNSGFKGGMGVGGEEEVIETFFPELELQGLVPKTNI